MSYHFSQKHVGRWVLYALCIHSIVLFLAKNIHADTMYVLATVNKNLQPVQMMQGVDRKLKFNNYLE